MMFIETQGPVTYLLNIIFADQQTMGRWQTAHLAENGAWSWNHVKVEVVEDRLRIEFVAPAFYTIGTIREGKPVTVDAVAKRFNGEMVNRQENRSLCHINYRYGISAPNSGSNIDTILAPCG